MEVVRCAVLGLLLAGGVFGLWWMLHRAAGHALSRPPRRPRVLHPRSPGDCPCCRAAGGGLQQRSLAPASVRPWREGASRRGRPRRISTAGYACPTPSCVYYGITDSAIHALVGDGHHGRAAPIQNFRCQACGTKVSERYGTPLYRLRTPASRVGEVLSALAEGLDV